MTDFMLTAEWKRSGSKGKKPASTRAAQAQAAAKEAAAMTPDAAAQKAVAQDAIANDDRRSAAAFGFADGQAANTVNKAGGHAAMQGKSDDLKLISGIGPKLETMLNEQGIFHFWQLADLNQAEADALETRLSFKGRIAREGWIGQAKVLSKAGSQDKASA